MTTEEIHRISEVQGFTDAIDPNETRFQTHTYTSLNPRNTHGSLIWATSILAQTGAHIIKALVMIFHKLDSIEDLLTQQEMRQRNKEDR